MHPSRPPRSLGQTECANLIQKDNELTVFKILIVDDHPLLAEGLTAVLEAAGFDVAGVASTVESGIEAYRRHMPEVVLLDLSLGERSGFDLVRDLIQRGFSPKVLVFTMHEDLQHATEAIRLGVLGYVLKGSPGASIIEAVKTVSRGERHYPPDLLFKASEAALRQTGPNVIDSLSDRERQVLQLVVSGHTSNSIGELLHLSPKTVDTYRSRLMSKLGVDDIASLVRFAIREGIASLD